MTIEHRLTDRCALATDARGDYYLKGIDGHFGDQIGTRADVLALRDGLSAWLGDGDARPLTVGAAVEIAHVVEFRSPEWDGQWMQVKAGERWRVWRPITPRWSSWTTPLQLTDDEKAAPCRLVALALADDPPESRDGGGK